MEEASESVFLGQRFYESQSFYEKSDNLVSITHSVWKERGLFVNIRSMQLGFSGFLKQVSCLMRLFNE